MFVDLETTGLAGGAGTLAFLVGCGWFDGGTFRVRQYLMSNVAGERALLQALTDVAGRCGTVVTYNGKTFDLPLIETRYLFHRMESPFTGMPHVDMLHPARRLWRPLGDVPRPAGGDEPVGRFESATASACRLTTLERMQCGFEREGDVPGWEIPDRYFAFVRSGDARPLEGVLEHNRLDILSLALVTAQTCQMLEEGPASARNAREALGLGRIYLSGGRLQEARECFADAGGLSVRPRESGSHAGEAMVQAEGLRAFALISRRARQFDDAETAWRRVLALKGTPPHIVREATDALAVHYEHRRRDLVTAKSYALRSLEFEGPPTREGAIRHRVARLDRKIERVEAIGMLF